MMAYVSATTGVLLTDDKLRGMSIGQLATQYHSLHKREGAMFDIVVRTFKAILVSTLGLNSIRPEDEHGVPKEPDKMTPEERESFLPLIAWVARPEMLKIVRDQLDASSATNDAVNMEEYERLVAAIDAAGGDMEPIIGVSDSIKGTSNAIVDNIIDTSSVHNVDDIDDPVDDIDEIVSVDVKDM